MKATKNRNDIFEYFAQEIQNGLKVLDQEGASYTERRNFEIVGKVLPIIGRNLRIIRNLLAFCVGSILGHFMGQLLRSLFGSG